MQPNKQIFKKLKTTCRLQRTGLRAPAFHNTRLHLGLLERSKKRQNSEVLGFTAICRASRGGEGREEAKWPEGKVGAGAGMASKEAFKEK